LSAMASAKLIIISLLPSFARTIFLSLPCF
jgi:hypothetical protein